MLAKTSIDELETLWDILTIAEDYKKKHSITPVNISHWDPSDIFKNKIIAYLRPPLLKEPIDYIFSYELQEAPCLSKAFGYDNSQSGILITPTGSVSILSVLIALKESGVNNIVALAPFYWSMRHVANKLQINVVPVYLERQQDCFLIPKDITTQTNKQTALWVTSPVYCTGVYYTEESLDLLSKALQRFDIVVLDESLSIHKKEIGPKLSEKNNVISIHTPHKSVCTNGLKFSSIVFSERYQHHFDHWSDALYGCLSVTNKEAVLHFLSKNFTEYSAAFHREIGLCRNRLVQLCEKYSVEFDSFAEGYLNTLYFPSVKSDYLSDPALTYKMLVACNGYFIPGKRNNFSDKYGLCFRVNHALDSPVYWTTVERIMSYFSSL